MHFFILPVLLFALSVIQVNAKEAVGFDQAIIYSQSDRPLKASIWYPSQNTFPRERVAENPAFVGTDIIRIGTAKASSYPLVILSHGYRGSWRNLNWLATRLTQQGFIVAAIDHPGTTTFNQDPALAAQWWQRPTDLSRLLDWLLEQSYVAPFIDTHNITAIGHSLGGWTVMALAGAKFDRAQLLEECRLDHNPRVCGLLNELGMDTIQDGEPQHSLQDLRIKRVISLDLGLARGFSRESLQQLSTPSLILAAGIDIGDLPQAQESGFLAEYIPDAMHEYIVYADATHFSFMQLCKEGAIEMIEEENPGDGIICQDGNQRTRYELHEKIADDILAFMKK
ncbi:alpha/beta fold hydrolase [Marinomonas sp. C2222]|uniref:Alpha/beta fold hydrolase n=1 Tax=Marinomonas sargassi TaxID=2984494 RepID=A0ABT2YQA1_9GAMM|nr:alpha/beta fold hydrolase [Marinomonas sargassi]MCV2401864.1 alpha/beta fold hydrolase [Marinomonas sargassi]